MSIVTTCVSWFLLVSCSVLLVSKLWRAFEHVCSSREYFVLNFTFDSSSPFFRFAIPRLPYHLELSQYFHALTVLYRHSDADPRDFSTVFGYSIKPEFTLHLVLQRTDDAKILASCPATLLPPALRPSSPADVLSRYESMSIDPAHAHMAFPTIGFDRQVPDEIHAIIREDLIKEQRDFVNHL